MPTEPEPTARSPLRRRLETALIGGGALLLAFVGAVHLDAYWAQRLAARQIQLSAADTPPEALPAPGSPVARLRSPDLDLDVVALEGVDPKALRRGVGHFPGTALPGRTGNVSFAGHRDTFFRGLRDAAPGQRVHLETPEATFVYEITETRIVEPDAVEVVAPLTGGSHLTLVTCYPFDWIGPAPQRFVVRASLTEQRGAAAAASDGDGSAVPYERTP
jgi:sortase A